MQRKTIVVFIMIEEILSDAVDDEVKKFVFFVEEEGHGEIAYLFFGIFVRRDEIDRFKMSKINVPSENIDI
jgi:hypothetical protein